jgi:hypothetical protein
MEKLLKVSGKFPLSPRLIKLNPITLQALDPQVDEQLTPCHGREDEQGFCGG